MEVVSESPGPGSNMWGKKLIGKKIIAFSNTSEPETGNRAHWQIDSTSWWKFGSFPNSFQK